MKKPVVTIDGNEATASVAHRLSEVIAIYPNHPLLKHGRIRRRVVSQGQKEHLGYSSRRDRNAI